LSLYKEEAVLLTGLRKKKNIAEKSWGPGKAYKNSYKKW
jgi:hypothetical protein